MGRSADSVPNFSNHVISVAWGFDTVAMVLFQVRFRLDATR